jgi:hypothetical protein
MISGWPRQITYLSQGPNVKFFCTVNNPIMRSKHFYLGIRKTCMARGVHGLPKVSRGPAMPNPSMPCQQATPKTALQPFLGWPARRAGGLRQSSTPLDTQRRTGLVLGDGLIFNSILAFFVSQSLRSPLPLISPLLLQLQRRQYRMKTNTEGNFTLFKIPKQLLFYVQV